MYDVNIMCQNWDNNMRKMWTLGTRDSLLTQQGPSKQTNRLTLTPCWGCLRSAGISNVAFGAMVVVLDFHFILRVVQVGVVSCQWWLMMIVGVVMGESFVCDVIMSQEEFGCTFGNCGWPVAKNGFRQNPATNPHQLYLRRSTHCMVHQAKSVANTAKPAKA